MLMSLRERGTVHLHEQREAPKSQDYTYLDDMFVNFSVLRLISFTAHIKLW